MAKILIAEDSETELLFLQEILKSTPYEITTTRDGKEAEAVAHREPIRTSKTSRSSC